MPNKNNNINNQLVASPLFPVTITIVSLYQITFIHAIHTMIIPPTLILHEIHRRWETPTKHLPRRGTLNSTQLFTFPRLDIKSTIEFSIHDLDIEECAGRGAFRSVWKAQQKQQAWWKMEKKLPSPRMQKELKKVQWYYQAMQQQTMISHNSNIMCYALELFPTTGSYLSRHANMRAQTTMLIPLWLLGRSRIWGSIHGQWRRFLRGLDGNIGILCHCCHCLPNNMGIELSSFWGGVASWYQAGECAGKFGGEGEAGWLWYCIATATSNMARMVWMVRVGQ